MVKASASCSSNLQKPACKEPFSTKGQLFVMMVLEVMMKLMMETMTWREMLT